MQDPKVTETFAPDAGRPDGARSLAPGTVVARRYLIETFLGAGGSSMVYAARDRELSRRVALKILRTDRDGEAMRRRFRREVAIARDANSPRLVRVFDIGEDSEDGENGGRLFITMELVEGRSLKQLLDEGPLGIDKALGLAREILEALKALHALGIVHRDVKPANVLLDASGPKLADFGLARYGERGDVRVTETEAMVGTLAYLSPEQALGREITGRSDLYSFGVLLFEMIAGRLPFDQGSSVATLVAHLNRAPASLRSLRPETPRWLSAVVGRLLSKLPEDRYASADEVLADLDRSKFTGPRRRRVLGIAALVTLATVTPVAWAAYERWADSRFSALLRQSDGGVRAVDAIGRTLWTDSRILAGYRATPIRVEGGKRIAAVLMRSPKESDDLERNRRLVLLDVQTGAIVSETRLAEGATFFRDMGFAPNFGVGRMTAVDLSGRGTDQVVLDYVHSPRWPGYSVLYDPGSDRSSVVFLGSGHHRTLGTVDVDGDGRKELILGGPNDPMGYRTALAAVRVPVTDTGGRAPAPACSPDNDCTVGAGHPLAWYALGPRYSAAEPDTPLRLRVEDRSLVLSVSGRETRFDLFGFATQTPSHLPGTERARLREEAYSALRRAGRFGASSRLQEALAEARGARQKAGEAADPKLRQWAGRVEAEVLLRAGQAAQAEALFTELTKDPEFAEEISLEAAHAFHLVGARAAALRWYRAARSGGGERFEGRPRSEALEGELLLLGEQHRWAEAREAVRTFLAAYPADDVSVTRCVQWIEWRDRGIAANTDGEGHPRDLHRYWVLEMKLARGSSSTRDLLTLVDETAASWSGRTGLLEGLRCELLLRAGRRDDAWASAQRALAQVRIDVETDVASRAHLDLVVARYARIARLLGKGREAREAEELVTTLLADRTAPTRGSGN